MTDTEEDEKITSKLTNVFDYLLTKSLFLCGTIALICVIILIIFIVIYCIVRKKRRSEMDKDNVSLSMKQTTTSDRHFEFKKLPNSSTLSNDITSNIKDNISLSELRVKNLSLNNSAALSTDSGRKRKKKGSRSNTESSDDKEKNNVTTDDK